MSLLSYANQGVIVTWYSRGPEVTRFSNTQIELDITVNFKGKGDVQFKYYEHPLSDIVGSMIIDGLLKLVKDHLQDISLYDVLEGWGSDHHKDVIAEYREGVRLKDEILTLISEDELQELIYLYNRRMDYYEKIGNLSRRSS